MRIVSRKEFLKLPPGTLYQQCREKWAFGDMHVKYDSLIFDESGDGDFVCAAFTSIEADSSEQLFDRMEDMCDNGASYPLELDCAGRDGLFERDALFMVYEKADVEALRDFFVDLAVEAGEAVRAE